MDANNLNILLQVEATEVLEKTKLLDSLSAIGIIELGGSYVYGTMVDEDIDIAVIVDEKGITYDFRNHIMDLLLAINGLDGIAMSDRFHFPRNGRPKGIWYGPIILHNDRRWNIDIWVVAQDEPYSHHNLELHKKMLDITEDQRRIMLDIKYSALHAGTKEKGVTSSQIYQAVLDNNITTYKEFENFAN